MPDFNIKSIGLNGSYPTYIQVALQELRQAALWDKKNANMHILGNVAV